MRNAILGFMVGVVIMVLIAVAQAQQFGSAIQKGSRTVAQTTDDQSPSQATKGPTVVYGKTPVAPADEPARGGV